VDWRALGFTLALSVATGLLFGVAPAWRAANINLHDALKETGRGASGGSGSTRFRSVLVVAEIALSMVLLIAAGLMIRTLSAMQTVDPGFRPDHVLSMRLSMASEKYPDAAKVRSFYRQVLDKIHTLPGVRSASISMSLPLQGANFGMPFQIASHPQVPVSGAPWR
jgi:putative ABC transport system permease protein